MGEAQAGEVEIKLFASSHFMGWKTNHTENKFLGQQNEKAGLQYIEEPIK